MSERRRYHPLALALHLFKGLKNSFVLIIMIAVSSYFFDTSLKKTLAISAIIGLIVLSAIWKYVTETYVIRSYEMVLYRGIFFKKEIVIPYERIQTMKQKQWFFLQPFGIVELLIETGGGGAEPEASMPAVSQELLDIIERHRRNETVAVATSEEDRSECRDDVDDVLVTQLVENELATVTKSEPHYQVSNRDILVFGVTDLGIFTVAFAIFFFIDDFLPHNWLEKVTDISSDLVKVGWVFFIGLIFVLVIVLAAISVIRQFIVYYRFIVQRDKDALIIESGLFERGTQKIPLHKIQGVRLRQQVLRRLFGLVSVELLLASGQDDTQDDHKLYLLPIIAHKKVYTELAYLLPEWQIETPDLHYLPKHRVWYFWRWWLLASIIVTGIGTYFNRWVLVGGLMAAIITFILAWLKAKNQSYAIQNRTRLCTQCYKGVTCELTFFERRRIQSIELATSKWLFPKGVGQLTFWLKCGSGSEDIVLKYLPIPDLVKLKAFYRQKADTTF
ncbi:hypothetical protein CBF34_09090 [Vagococcus penaei]|uniref:YdbS-like PH domain-containing protein n=1 Tax=Vagococcus penaei TaxID=633807 RepID=A0A1Q2D5S2_9ENTE|nr:PH domain-containing protein [Vagococcus penaei]AQP53704.1 hypothetical protein BW732_05260 [Vagococcus penaei]RST99453.1 hypothetical protein CBF34_09090 [Vagococcus penaei]